METETITLGETRIEVRRKPIKHVHLTVHPPEGAVRLTAPPRLRTETLRLFAVEKLPWIRNQQRRLRQQERETPRKMIERETHFVWGRRCLLKVEEVEAAPTIEARPRSLILRVRPGTRSQARDAILQRWYRDILRVEADERLAHWLPKLRVARPEIRVRRMRTKWGTCNPEARRILLNTWLAKKPPECLDYILLHELVHLVHRDHGPEFTRSMDRHMPSWRQIRARLQQLPTGPEEWETG